MPFYAPFSLGPFNIDAEGRLTPNAPDNPPNFLVRWHNRPVRARMISNDDADARLSLQTVLGRVPSSAAIGAPGERSHSFELLRGLRAGLPNPWKLRLLPDHRAVLEAETQIALPITAVGLIATVTRFLMAMGPYIELAEEAGFRPVGGQPPARQPVRA